MKKPITILFFLLLTLISSCSVYVKPAVWKLRHGNRTTYGYWRCPSVNPYRHQFKMVRKKAFKIRLIKH